MVEAPTIRNFVKSFGGQWFTRMSGPLTVPFTIAALFVPHTWLKVLFAILAIACGVVSSYGVWAVEREKRGEAEQKLQDEEPKLIFALLDPNLGWANGDSPNVDSFGEFIFTLTNYGKRPASFVRIEPIRSVSGIFTLSFDDVAVLRPDAEYRRLKHWVDDGVKKTELDKRKLWNFLHNCPAERQSVSFDVVIHFRDMQEEKQQVAKMSFDLNTYRLEIAPH